MQSARRVAFGLLAAAAVASASDVHQLTKDTFNDFVKDNDLVLAECESFPPAGVSALGIITLE